MRTMLKLSQGLLEKGLIPDVFIRFGIRGLLKEKLNEERRNDLEFGYEQKMKLVNQLKGSPIAVNTREANQQHYELPTEFFRYCLGTHLKYSGCYYRDGVNDLSQAEEDMLRITTERADLRDGQSVLELGCGWGSLTLFMAEHFPNSQIKAVSNSATQKQYIDSQLKERGLNNVEILTADMNDFSINQNFDRVVSVEMFEHMRNYQNLLTKVAGFLKDDGKLFVHIFTHKEFAYLYDETDESDWIAKYFFTGGIMPSDDLLLYFQDHFKIAHHWRISGIHYQKTAEHWLENMDRHKTHIMPLMVETYGSEEAGKWWVYWRVFFMACAELWGYNGGNEWIISHYLFTKRKGV